MTTPDTTGPHWGLIEDFKGRRWILVFINETCFGQRYMTWAHEDGLFEHPSGKAVEPEILEWRKIEKPEVP